VERENFPLDWRAQMCGLLLLGRGLPASEGSVTEPSAAMGTGISLRDSEEWSIEGKAERIS
jgi:hypothetical protein